MVLGGERDDQRGHQRRRDQQSQRVEVGPSQRAGRGHRGPERRHHEDQRRRQPVVGNLRADLDQTTGQPPHRAPRQG